MVRKASPTVTMIRKKTPGLRKVDRRSSPHKSARKEIELPAEVPETQEASDTDEDEVLSVEELKPVNKEGDGRAGDEEFLV